MAPTVSNGVSILPEPGPELKQHSSRLTEKLKRRIHDGGPISFYEFMEAALYEPGLGYYSAGLQKLGPGGDFVTAPECGNLFARCLAKLVAAAGARLGRYCVLELGAGTGALAADLLTALNGQPPECYLILERSADLRERQAKLIAERVPGLAERVHWVDEPPRQFKGIILGNEVADALPVERFRIADGQVLQLCVDLEEDRLVETSRLADQQFVSALRSRLPEPDSLVNGYTSEFNPALRPWLDGLAAGLDSGLLLLIDYGYPAAEYYHPTRRAGTLQCHYRHRAHDDYLFWPGLQDITARVDFSALADAGSAAGLQLLTYNNQAEFLFACGLLELLEAHGTDLTPEYLALAGEVKQLTLPGEMGDVFQVMVFGKAIHGPLPGVQARDLRHRL